MSEIQAVKPQVLIYSQRPSVSEEVQWHVEERLEGVQVDIRKVLQIGNRGVFETVPDLTVLAVLTGPLVRHPQMADIRRFFSRKEVGVELCEGYSQRDFQLLQQALDPYADRVRLLLARHSTPQKRIREKKDYSELGEYFNLKIIAGFESGQAWKAFDAIANADSMPIRNEKALFRAYQLRGEDPSEWPEGVGSLSIDFIRQYLVATEWIRP